MDTLMFLTFVITSTLFVWKIGTLFTIIHEHITALERKITVLERRILFINEDDE